MCEFCIKHGEGKTWYLNVKNYSNDLLSDIKRRKLVKGFFHWTNYHYRKSFKLLKLLSTDIPIIGPAIKAIIKGKFAEQHWGQVIPIEDVEKVLSLTNSIVRIPCICRKVVAGREERTCFLISVDPKSIGIAEIVDKSFFGGPDIARFESFNKIQTLDFMRTQEKKGMVHSIWSFRAPFIGALCNCDDTGCLAIKMHKEIVAPFFRSEYIVDIDFKKCIGCKTCISLCLFDALIYDEKTKKIKVNYKKCYGCGICRSVCKEKALQLISRKSNAETAKLW